MLSDVFDRFVEKRPISVMVRASLERVLGADRLTRDFLGERDNRGAFFITR